MVVGACNPATQEAEAQESIELGGRSGSDSRSRHCTPAWATVRLSLSLLSLSLSLSHTHTHTHTQQTADFSSMEDQMT